MQYIRGGRRNKSTRSNTRKCTRKSNGKKPSKKVKGHSTNKKSRKLMKGGGNICANIACNYDDGFSYYKGYTSNNVTGFCNALDKNMNEYLFIDFGKDDRGKDITVKVLDLEKTLKRLAENKDSLIPDYIKNNKNFQNTIKEYREKENFAALARKTADHLFNLHNENARNGCRKISKN